MLKITARTCHAITVMTGAGMLVGTLLSDNDSTE